MGSVMVFLAGVVPGVATLILLEVYFAPRF